jgi:tRNA modification GTPase
VIDAEDEALRSRASLNADPPTWLLRNKIDLVSPGRRTELRNEDKIIVSDIVYDLSATTGLGLAEFLSQLTRFAKSYFGVESGILTRERHRNALNSTKKALDRALMDSPKKGEEIVAEELRSAAQTLGRLTGRVDVEDILDVIFRDFCIGK